MVAIGDAQRDVVATELAQALRGGEPYLAFGTPGGDCQDQRRERQDEVVDKPLGEHPSQQRRAAFGDDQAELDPGAAGYHHIAHTAVLMRKRSFPHYMTRSTGMAGML